MEKFQEWRNEKAEELKEIPDQDDRKERLTEIQSDNNYLPSKRQHILDRLHIKSSRLRGIPKEAVENIENSLVRYVTPVEDLISGINTEKMSALDTKIAPPKNYPKEFDPIYTPYSDYALEMIGKLNKDQMCALKESFKKKIIVDIGAGRFTKGYDLACILEAKGYVAVEPFNFNYLLEDFLLQSGNLGRKSQWSSTKKGTKFDPIPYNIVAEDGLNFLRRIPDHSVVVFTFGLNDHAVINDGSYVSEMAKEMERVTENDCYIITADSISRNPEGSSTSELIRGQYAQIRKVVPGEVKKSKIYKI